MALPLHAYMQEEAQWNKFLKALICCAGGHRSGSVHPRGVTGACIQKVLQEGVRM